MSYCTMQSHNLHNMIPTTEELFRKYSNLYQFEEGDTEYLIDKEDFQNIVVWFTELHVEAAIKKAADIQDRSQGHDCYKAILDCYPLTNIK